MKSESGLAKLTRGNQVTIPRHIVQRIGLKQGRDYLKVEYDRGSIVMKPVEIRERIPDEVYSKPAEHSTQVGAGDVKATSRAARKILRERRKTPPLSSPPRPRAGWAEAARRMREQGQDRLLDRPTLTRFDDEEWRWR